AGKLAKTSKPLVAPSAKASTSQESTPKSQASMLADQAMSLAEHAEKEQGELEELEKQFRAIQDGSPEHAQAFVQTMATLAHQYLQLASASFADPKDSEFVRDQLNGLAAKSFEILAKFADASPHGEIKKLAPLYDGYRFLAQGDIEAGRNAFEK